MKYDGISLLSLSSSLSSKHSKPSSCGMFWYAPIMSDVARIAFDGSFGPLFTFSIILSKCGVSCKYDLCFVAISFILYDAL